MSQTNTSLLDKVEQWSQETCRHELKNVLPKLTISSQIWNDHIRILKIITEKFLPHIGLPELEEECFSKILPKAVSVFHSMMEELLDQVAGLSSQNTELCSLLRNILQAMMQLIDTMSSCVRHVGAYEDPPDLDAIRSLPTCILKVLRETFQHCKDSEVVYCGRLSLVADLLQGLFKEAYTLQKGLLELLDKMTLNSSTAEEEVVSDIVTMIHSLLDICLIISNLDMALHANTWKFLIKQSLKYQSLVEEHLHHGDIISSLCDNLLASFHNCVELAEQIKRAGLQEAMQTPEYKLFQRTAKMCRFFANTLVHYIKEFKFFLTKCCSRFHQLYLQVISKFPPSMCAPTLSSALSEELNAAALVPMDAFLLQLLPLRAFAEVVLHPEHELPHCLLLVNVLGQLTSQPEEVLQLWYTGSQFSEETPRLPLYQALFTSFRQCHTERQVPVLLPGVMMKGQALVQISLHHHLCVHLCASVAALPPLYFSVLEYCLVSAVLQADTQTALLATDVWCFIARYGTAELCLHHVLLIAHSMLQLRDYKHFELVARFPPSHAENLPVWQHVLLRALSQDARHRVGTDIIGLTQKVLTDWQNGGHKLGQVDRVVRTMSKRHTVQRHLVLQSTLQLLLSISAILVKNIDHQVILQALVCVDAVLSQQCAEPQLLLAALDFLSSLGKIFVPPESQNQILPRLSSLFGVLLSHRSWLLHQHALEAFSQFAEITNHEEVISQSLCEEDTKTKVVNYLSKTLNTPEDVDLRLKRIKKETAVTEQHNKRLENKKENVLEGPVPHTPCPKRARQETSAEEEYSRYIQTAESALKAIQELTEGKASTAAPPPQWLDSRLQELRTLITNINTARHTT
uniref:Uncharacterized protein n=1 Tax=Mola mola TaxID=94237 RepID=A0A3Q3XJU8_MOLML